MKKIFKYKYRIICLLMQILVSASMLGATPKEVKKAYKEKSKGDAYLASNVKSDVSNALDHYQKALEYIDNDADLFYKLGKCYFIKDKLDTAYLYLQQAYALNKNMNNDLCFLLGSVEQGRGHIDTAIKYFTQYDDALYSDTPDDIANQKKVAKKLEECAYAKKAMKSPIRVRIDKMCDSINSVQYDGYGPIVNADETIIVFTSVSDQALGGKKDKVTKGYYENVYISEMDQNENWTKAKNMGTPINQKKKNVGAVYISPDGSQVLIYRSKHGGDLYSSSFDGDKWSKPKSLGKNINTKKYHEGSATMTSDGNTLYFVSNKPGGYGGHDIYKSAKDSNGKWAKPENLGPIINTPYEEISVFMMPDNRTLYFSSQGHDNMGGFDIFRTELDSSGNWTTPVNVGYPVNTTKDEVFFSVSASGKNGYMSSRREDADIYSIYKIQFLGKEKQVLNNSEDNLLSYLTTPIADNVDEAEIEIQKTYLTLLKGFVFDEITKDPLKAQIVLTDNGKNEIIATFESNPKTGKFLVSLPSGFNYGIAVKAEGYLFDSENFDIPVKADYQEIYKDIPLKAVGVGKKIILRNVFFDVNKYELLPASFTELNNLAKLMNDVPKMKIEISGHTDNRGSQKLNKELSQNRALAVVKYLISAGIDPERLTYMGYGYEQPVAPNTTPEGRALNRRTEFKIIQN